VTDSEWKKEELRLKRAITRARNASKDMNLTLAQKLTHKEKVKGLEAEHFSHRLNYFQLTTEQVS